MLLTSTCSLVTDRKGEFNQHPAGCRGAQGSLRPSVLDKGGGVWNGFSSPQPNVQKISCSRENNINSLMAFWNSGLRKQVPRGNKRKHQEATWQPTFINNGRVVEAKEGFKEAAGWEASLETEGRYLSRQNAGSSRNKAPGPPGTAGMPKGPLGTGAEGK